MKAWPYIPGVPAAGHITSRGYWHPGPINGCSKCGTTTTTTKGQAHGNHHRA